MIAFIEARIVNLRPIWLITTLILIALVKAGIWSIPNTKFLALLAENPFRNPYEGAPQYLFSNWLVGFFAWLLHARDNSKYVALNFLYSCIFMAVTIVSMRRILPDPEWRKAACLFLCLPVSWVHLYWIGYDSLTLTLMSVMIAGLRLPWLTFVVGVGLGLQHQSQGFFAVAWLLLGTIAIKNERPDGSRYILGSATALGGVLAGILVLQSIIWANNIHLDFDRTTWLAEHLKEILFNNTVAWWTFAYCLLGPGWLIVLRKHGSSRLTLTLGCALLASAALTFVSDDVTRVFSILTYPVIAFCLLYNRRWLASVSYKEVAMILAVWIVVPWLFFWAGRPRTSLFVYDVAAVSRTLFSWPASVSASILIR